MRPSQVVVVTGGRDYPNRAHVFAALDRVHRETPIRLLIHGACGWDRDKHNGAKPMQGADRWADEWARERKVNHRRMPARWAALGGKAGPMRNREMIDLRPDRVIAFPGGTGTTGCIVLAQQAGIPVEVQEPRVEHKNMTVPGGKVAGPVTPR